MRSTPRHSAITVSGVTGTNPPYGQHDPYSQPHDPTGGWQTPDGFYLNQMAPPPPPPRRWSGWLVALIAVGSLLALGLGVGAITTLTRSDTTPAAGTAPAATTAAPTTAPTTAPARPNDPPGLRACDAVKAANAGPNTFAPEPAAMAAIAADGRQSTNTWVASAARSLGTTAELAAAAKGDSDEAMWGLKLGTAALELETECIRNGYYPRPS